MRIQGSQNSATSDDANAKWRAWSGTRVSINSSKKTCIKNCVVSIDTLYMNETSNNEW